MKMGDVVSHTLNENARGLILTEGKSAMGLKFFIVGWFDGERRNCVQTNRNTPQELIAL
jgi:hypothetical protein